MVENKVDVLLRPLIDDMGYVLWGCEYLPQGQYSVLRIYIDKVDGIRVEDCQEVSHAVSAILDVEDIITGHYTLEISSPGVPRPIFYGWQYRQYIGQSVQIKLNQPLEGRRKYIGIIVSVDETKLVLHTGDAEKHFLVSNIVKANLIVE